MLEEVDFSKGVRGKHYGRVWIVGPIIRRPRIKLKNFPCDCGGWAKRKPFTGRIKFLYRPQGFRVRNFPAFRCFKCGESYYDGPPLLDLERKLKRIFLAQNSEARRGRPRHFQR